MANNTIYALLPGVDTDYDHWDNWINPDGNASVLKRSADPPGYYISACYSPPISIGDMSMFPVGAGVISSDLYASKSMSIDFTGSSTFSAAAALVVSMAAAFTGNGSITAAIEGRLNMSADLAGSGSMTSALSALANMAVGLLGSGSLQAAIAAYGNMDIDIVVTGTGLSTANVGQAVWTFLIGGSEAQTLLAAAGAAGDPWATPLPGTYPAGSAGDIIGHLSADTTAAIMAHAVESGWTLDQIIRVLAAVLAGKVSGAGTATETFRSINDVKDRVVATVDANGNRTAITLDGT